MKEYELYIDDNVYTVVKGDIILNLDKKEFLEFLKEIDSSHILLMK